MADSNVYSVICLDEYYNLGAFTTSFTFRHYIDLNLDLNLSEQYLDSLYNNIDMNIECYFEIVGYRFKTLNNHLYILTSDKGYIFKNHPTLNSIKSVIQVLHNIPYRLIEVDFQFVDYHGNNLKVIYNGDSCV